MEPTITEREGGFVVAEYPDGNVVVKTPCGKYFSAVPEDFCDTTLTEYFESCFEKPLQTLVLLANVVQYHPSLINEMQTTLMKHFVPRVLAPIQHIHHNMLAIKSLNFWNPLTVWDNPATQFSRICIASDCANTYVPLLRYKQLPEGNFITAKLKGDVPKIKEALEHTPLVFANKYDNLTFRIGCEELKAKRTFVARDVVAVDRDLLPNELPVFNLACIDPTGNFADWGKPFLYACASYIHSDFCRDPHGEREAFIKIVGPQFEQFEHSMWDHHLVNKKRFKEYEEGNPYTSQNEVSFDYATPACAADKPLDFTLTVELDEFRNPIQRVEFERKKAEKEAAKAAKVEIEK